MIHKCEGECVHTKEISNKSASVKLEGGNKKKKKIKRGCKNASIAGKNPPRNKNKQKISQQNKIHKTNIFLGIIKKKKKL